MKETVTDPLLFFLASILFGVCLQAIYDIIRGIRRVFYHTKLPPKMFYTSYEQSL